MLPKWPDQSLEDVYCAKGFARLLCSRDKVNFLPGELMKTHDLSPTRGSIMLDQLCALNRILKAGRRKADQ